MIYSDRIDKLQDKVEELSNNVAKQHHIQVLQNGIIETNVNDAMALQIEIRNMNGTSYDRNRFNDLVNFATQSMLIHNMETAKFMNITKGDTRANFFNIVDLDKFM